MVGKNTMNNSTQGEKHSEKETRSDLNILQRYLEMINEGDIELSALRLQAYTKYLEVKILYRNILKDRLDQSRKVLVGRKSLLNIGQSNKQQ